jgi:hypothetical protein
MRTLNAQEILALRVIIEEAGLVCGDFEGYGKPDVWIEPHIFEGLIARGLITKHACTCGAKEHGEPTSLGRLAFRLMVSLEALRHAS